MEKIILIIFSFFFLKNLNGQEDGRYKANLIIMIDGQIPFQGDVNLNFIVENENQKIDTIGISYVPGDILISKSAFNKMQSKDVKSIILELRYTVVCQDIKSYNYKIDFYKTWLLHDFSILRIYNLDKKKNKEIFFPLKGREYTYEIDTPNGSITRVKKKNYKEKCN
jgi:hypothetical protein